MRCEGESGERARSVRTDVIVFLPGGRNLVIDSKVSLTAYTDCVNAADEDARKIALKSHLASVRGHISGLAKAGYHNLPGIETPDFVVMFVPIEPALLMALQSDGELWADAYKQGILLVGPTTCSTSSASSTSFGSRNARPAMCAKSWNAAVNSTRNLSDSSPIWR